MNKEEYRTGLWKKESQKGNTYYSGKLKIGDKEFQCSLFKNNKTNEKQPDLNLIVRDSINTQGKQESALKGQKNTELEQVKDPLKDEKTFEQFYMDELDLTDDDGVAF
jgi:hypothetical protein